MILLLPLLTLAGGACGGGLFFGPLVPAPPTPRAQAAVMVDEAWRRASDVPHVSVFYDALAPYGVWEESRELGWIWTPSDERFTPYSRGRWVETEAGPTFLADEPYGWAVAHYGRWLWREGGRDAQRGRWYWVPGTRWGPAWVAWRVSEQHVGWRALAPSGWSRPAPDAAWRFVPAREFLNKPIGGRTYGARDVPWLVASSRPHEREAPDARFVVGPEVRYAGWRARRVPLGGLPAAKIRWVPRWERETVPRAQRSVRVGPDAPDRRARKALTGPSER